MRRSLGLAVLLVLAVVPRAYAAGCGDYAPAVEELRERTFTFPLGLVAAGDGALWVAATFEDRLIAVDPARGPVAEVQLPLGSHPVGVALDPRGRVWFAGSGVGLVGRVTAGVRRAAEFPSPRLFGAKKAPAVWGMAVDAVHGHVWYTMPLLGIVGRVALDAEPSRRGSVVNETQLEASGRSRPEGVAVDARGGAWVADATADRLVRVSLDAAPRSVALVRGGYPRGVAVGPDGAVWATLFHGHALVRVDAGGGAVQQWDMPAGARSNPLAVAAGADGLIWVADLTANALTCFDPRASRFVSWTLPTPNAGVRALALDPHGSVWSVGSLSGRLAVLRRR